MVHVFFVIFCHCVFFDVLRLCVCVSCVRGGTRFGFVYVLCALMHVILRRVCGITPVLWLCFVVLWSLARSAFRGDQPALASLALPFGLHHAPPFGVVALGVRDCGAMVVQVIALS